jgi:hypothetical protein
VRGGRRAGASGLWPRPLAPGRWSWVLAVPRRRALRGGAALAVGAGVVSLALLCASWRRPVPPPLARGPGRRPPAAGLRPPAAGPGRRAAALAPLPCCGPRRRPRAAAGAVAASPRGPRRRAPPPRPPAAALRVVVLRVAGAAAGWLSGAIRAAAGRGAGVGRAAGRAATWGPRRPASGPPSSARGLPWRPAPALFGPRRRTGCPLIRSAGGPRASVCLGCGCAGAGSLPSRWAPCLAAALAAPSPPLGGARG